MTLILPIILLNVLFRIFTLLNFEEEKIFTSKKSKYLNKH